MIHLTRLLILVTILQKPTFNLYNIVLDTSVHHANQRVQIKKLGTLQV